MMLAALQQQARELLKTSKLSDDMKKTYWDLLPLLPAVRIQPMIELLKKEQNILQGKLSVSPERAKAIAAKYKTFERNVWKIAEEDNTPPAKELDKKLADQLSQV